MKLNEIQKVILEGVDVITIKGDRGIQGIQGEQGERGPEGKEGKQGIQGIQGIQGEKGEKGDRGEKGDSGKDAEIDVPLLQREIARHGGGGMSRQIRVEGVDVLKKYNDINLIGTTSSVLAIVDDTNKRVTIKFPSGSGGGTWGTITGTLSAQTDLQTALDAKVSAATSGFTTYALNTLDGTVNVPHGLGKTPKQVIVKAIVGDGQNLGYADAFVTASGCYALYSALNIPTSQQTENGISFKVVESPNAGQFATAVISFDSTNIIFEWTFGGAIGLIADIIWTAIG